MTRARRSGWLSFIIVALFPLGFVILGGGNLVQHLVIPYLKTRDARKWPTVTAEITSTDHETRIQPGQGGSIWLTVKYRYEHEGRWFTSARYSFQEPIIHVKGLREPYERTYATGARITCYVNPEQPGEAVLFRRWLWNRDAIAILAIAGVLTLTGTLWLGFMIYLALYAAWAAHAEKSGAGFY